MSSRSFTSLWVSTVLTRLQSGKVPYKSRSVPAGRAIVERPGRTGRAACE